MGLPRALSLRKLDPLENHVTTIHIEEERPRLSRGKESKSYKETFASVKDLFRIHVDDEEHTPETKCTGTFVRGRKFIIHPHSKFSIVWNCMVMALTLALSIILPVQVAWYSSPDTNTAQEMVLGISIITVVVYTIDMFVECNTAVTMEGGIFLTRRAQIIPHYLKTWFLVDLISTLPWDLIISSNSNSNLQLLRLLKLLRLSRLFSHMLPPDVVRHIEENHALPYDAIDLFKFFSALALTTHIMGCGLFMLVDQSEDGTAPSFLDLNGLVGAPPSGQYVIGLYWAAYTLSTIGYGDIELVTYAERGYAIVCMLVGASVYAYLIGAVIGMLLSMNATEQDRRNQVKSVNQLMARVILPEEEQHRIRCYFSRTSASNIKQLGEEEIFLTRLSPPLAALITRHVHRKWLPDTWWMATDDDTFTVRFALMICEQSFFQKEHLFRKGNSACAMFVLRSGVMLRQNERDGPKYECAITDGRHALFGKDAILRTNRYYTYSCIAKTVCDVWRIDRQAFMELLDQFPRLRARMRWESCFMLLRRFPGGVKGLRIAKERREEMEKEFHENSLTALALALSRRTLGVPLRAVSEKMYMHPTDADPLIDRTISLIGRESTV